MNTRIISGMSLRFEEKANQMQDVTVISFVVCVFSCGLISHPIGHCRNLRSKTNHSVHGFWIRTVKDDPGKRYVQCRNSINIG